MLHAYEANTSKNVYVIITEIEKNDKADPNGNGCALRVCSTKAKGCSRQLPSTFPPADTPLFAVSNIWEAYFKEKKPCATKAEGRRKQHKVRPLSLY